MTDTNVVLSGFTRDIKVKPMDVVKYQCVSEKSTKKHWIPMALIKRTRHY